MDKHKVIIRRQEYEAYITKGYGLSASSVEDLLGPSGRLLQEEDMLVVEIDVVKYQRLNQGERAFTLFESNYTNVCRHQAIVEVLVLEKDEYGATVARADVDGMPWFIRSNKVYSTKRELAEGEAASLREKVRLLRKAADEMEEFMKRIECPPV